MRAHLSVALTAVLATSVLAGCSSTDDGTIKVGAIAGLTGNFITAEVVKTAQQVFDDANANGGVNGKKIEYVIKDDAGNPQRTAQVARELDSAGVVAMAGSASFTDCDVNDAYYRQTKIHSIMAVGASPKCFQSPNIAPVNVGPFTLMTAVLLFASKDLGAKSVCNFTVVLPGSEDAIKSALGDWERISDQKLVVNDMTVQQSGDLTPYLLKAKQAGCDAILFNPAEQLVVPWLQAAKTQGMTDVDFLLLAPAYTDSVAKAVGGLGLKIHAGSEFEPFTVESPANADWRSTVAKAKQPATAFSQGGYLAATFLVAVLRSIKGEVTRDSVNAALRDMAPITNPMLGTPFAFGPADKHAPNQASKMVRLENSRWVSVGDGFITIPGS
ncbi:Branched-chain amino acid ABC transporter, periplasmic amino acid-binding protein, putative [Alloactinosynnema sp. L-07]|uniref:ABC transporter substrate-binding protein n=1 Tax=Alloactinosynnema sp. L-07 TaxID=1653480 RepID=UPI00065EFED5|nr:ABC transporter substrate-binding protein [Alloactinosynnema sp. L-07]CRK57852.1 Branched-chain amino acid ABC transporter, periplasmic amino acid-binding protein, putative [Alloactinosynnema sp. L-07]